MNATANAVAVVCVVALTSVSPVATKHASNLPHNSSATQQIRDFRPQDSGITADGSKIVLAFERFVVEPSVMNPEQLTFTLRYPTNGGTGTNDEAIECRLVRIANTENLKGEDITTVTCHLGPPAIASDNATGYIRSADEIRPPRINLPQGWASNTNNEVSQQISNYDPKSLIEYPKPIVTWDVVPHQVFDGEFDIDVVALHMHSYPGSPLGDLKVELKVDFGAGTTGFQQATFREKTPQRAGFPKYGVYGITFDAADFLEGGGTDPYDGPATVKFKVTPARGDAQSILLTTPYSDSNTYVAGRGVQPNTEELRIFLNGGGSFTKLYAVVDPDAAGPGMISADPAVARIPANRFRTIYAAKEAFRVRQPPVDHLAIILLQPGIHAYGARPGEPVPGGEYANLSWLVIKPDDLDTPPVTRDQVTITNAAFSLTFDVEEETAFKFHRTANSDTTLQWRWTTSIFQIRNRQGNINFGSRREPPGDPPTVGDLVAAMNAYFMEHHNSQVQGEVVPGHEGWLLERADVRFIGITELEDLPAPNVDVNVPGWVRARVTIEDRGDRWMDIEYDETTHEYNLSDFDTIPDLITQLQTDFPGVFVSATEYLGEVIPSNLDHTVDSDMFDERPLTFMEENEAHLNTKYIQLDNCQTFNLELVSSTSAAHHLWMHRCLTKDATESGVDSSAIVATDNLFRGGVWFTEQEWHTANKCTAGCVMARDCSVTNIGADVFKQCTYACNIKGSDVGSAFPFYAHADHFQWSPGARPGEASLRTSSR